MTREERIKLRQTQCNAVNQIIPRVDKYFIEYCKALKEIWKTKIDGGYYGRYKDLEVLESHGLGIAPKHNWNEVNFKWNSEISELNKFYKQCCKY